MMNINQLSNSIDSLNNEFKKRQEKYSLNFKEKFNIKVTSYTDTILKTSDQKTIKKTLLIIINKVKSTKSILKSNSDDLKYRLSIINRHKIEWHRKFSLALCVLFYLLLDHLLDLLLKKEDLEFLF